MVDREGYWKLAEIEQRFNDSASGVRTLASAWILSALGAIGWLLDASKAPDAWHLPVAFLATLVCTLATAGVATLWVMDQLVFHRLLDSVFLVGLRMEYASPSLPPIRHVMLKTMEGQGTHRWERLFYCAPMLAFVLVSMLLLLSGPELFASSDATLTLLARPLSMLLVALQVAIAATVFFKQAATSLIDRAAWFADPAFEDAISNGNTLEVIARARPGVEDQGVDRTCRDAPSSPHVP